MIESKEINKEEFIADDNTVRCGETGEEIGYVIKKSEKKKHNSPNQTENVGGAPVKYTKDVVTQQLTIMLKQLKDNKDYVYIGELFEDKDYTRFRYSEWVKTYSEVPEIQKLSHTIKEILETRAVKGLMKNELNATGTIFHLKNNYGWVDKQVNENTNTNLNLEVEDSGEMKDLLSDNGLI